MKALITFAFCSLLASATVAFADANSAAITKANGLKPPRAYTGVFTPGKTAKSSAFAPTAGGSKRRVYGDPIQSPIFKMQPPKKPTVPPTPK
jgi:hypothetical protein